MVSFDRLIELYMRRLWIPILSRNVTIVALIVIASTMCRAAERTIAIARSDCELAVRYVAPSGANYQPGVDVNGRLVVPADLDGDHRLQLPDSIPVVITEDVRERFRVSHHSPLFDADAVVGIVELRLSDRRLTFNGAELSDPEANALAAMCRDATKSP
jgi:hypothetical protein